MPILNIETLITEIHRIDTAPTVVNGVMTGDKHAKTAELIKDYVYTSPSQPKSNGNPIPSRLNDVLDALSKDHNLLKSTVVNKLMSENILTQEHFQKMGIGWQFMQALASGQGTQNFNVPKPLEKINRRSTEVYFWGIPSSGKSCAIGAIISMAAASKAALCRSIFEDNHCQGYDYMMRLKNLFKMDGRVTALPNRTPVIATYEMGFDLNDHRGHTHPITFIDLAGELIRCMYKKDVGQDLAADERAALDVLDKILVDERTQNQKLHFFVLEYGGEAREYEGLSQASYLAGALNYIRSKGIFRDRTDGIYLLVTKADKAGMPEDELPDYLMEYIYDTHGYQGFAQGLRALCEQHHINGGELNVFPFSLGEVCFKDYCVFNGKYTEDVITELVKRTWWNYEWETKWWAAPFRLYKKFVQS